MIFVVKRKENFFGGYVKQITKIMFLNVRGILIVIVYKFSTQILIVSSKGIVVNNESMSRLAMCKLESCWKISSAKWNESMTVNSLAVEGVKNFSKNLANL